MKKIVLIALCFVMLAAMAVPAKAADEIEITVTTSKIVAQRGETVDFTVSVSSNVSYTSVLAEINFDSDVFEFVSGQDIATTGVVVQYDGVSIGLMGVNGSYSGGIQVLTFRVKETAPMKTVTITGSAQASAAGQSAFAAKFSGTSISVNCEHSYPKDQDGKFVYTQVGSDKHQQTCEKCGTPNVESHNWDEGTGKPAPTCDQGGTMEYTCTTCKATRTETVGELGHLWDNDCDTDCNRACGYVREATHEYLLVNTDPQAHWYQCACGSLKPGSWEEHIPGAEPTETTAQVCTVCNYELKPASGHQHVLETEWTTDATHHWHRCEKKNPSCYYVADKAKHDYDNDCDVTCNTCAYVREAPHNYKPEWQANAQGHWQICADCNAKSSVLEHVPGPEATMDTPQLCTECNFRIKMPLSHEHSFGEAWYSDDASHWQSCSECQESTELIPHEWEEGVEQADGKMQYTCSVCGHQVLTDGAVPTEPTVPPTTQAPTTQTPAGSSDSGRFPWEWAGLAAIILLAIGVILLVIEFIRSRKTNMHGKFSK